MIEAIFYISLTSYTCSIVVLKFFQNSILNYSASISNKIFNIMFFFTFWRINSQFGNLFRSLGDRSYPLKTVRAIILMWYVSWTNKNVSRVIRDFINYGKEYDEFSLRLGVIVTTIFMLGQTLMLYYLMDVGFKHSKR